MKESITTRPLGLLPEVKVTQKVLTKLVLIESLDIDQEKESAEEKDLIKPIEIEVAARELKRFLALRLLEPKPRYNFVPAPAVDTLWHRLILNTPKYVKFCDDVYGHYLHHVPRRSKALERADVAGEKSRYTKELLAKYFGGRVPSIWGEAIDCDQLAGCDDF